ncbi:MAG: hypothetical protein JWM21_2558 [Acidobacteria bacterium]|nr:hypothetical protein [Acidobacteriota bacterium]
MKRIVPKYQMLLLSSAIAMILVLMWLTSSWTKFADYGLTRELAVFLVLMLALLTILTVVLSTLLWTHLKPTKFEEKKDFILLIAQIVGGLTIIVSLFSTWRGLLDTQRQIRMTEQQVQETKQLAQATLDNTLKQQLAERYAKAVDQLSQKENSGRIGAIYDLGKLAGDFEDYYWPVVQVLTAYIREHSPWPAAKERMKQSVISPDIQAALEVLAWRRRQWEKGEGQRLNLFNTDMRGAVLKSEGLGGAHFEGARMVGANLDHASLRGVQFQEAILEGATLRYAILYDADLTGAALTDADLEGTDMHRVKGLTVDQLLAASNPLKANLEENLKQQVKEEHDKRLKEAGGEK